MTVARDAAAQPREYRLVNTYRWHLRVGVATVLLLLVAAMVFSGSSMLRFPVLAVFVFLYLGYVVPQLLRLRGGMARVGPELKVRRLVSWTTLRGPDVTKVRQVFSPGSPNFRVSTTARPRGVLVPTADLERGHSTLFNWLLTFAPQAELDPKALATVEQLTQRGLLDATPPNR